MDARDFKKFTRLPIGTVVQLSGDEAHHIVTAVYKDCSVFLTTLTGVNAGGSLYVDNTSTCNYVVIAYPQRLINSLTDRSNWERNEDGEFVWRGPDMVIATLLGC